MNFDAKGLDLPGSSNAKTALSHGKPAHGTASHRYLLPPITPTASTTTCCLSPLPAAYRLPPQPTASHHYLLPSHHYLLPPTTPCCLPRLLIPKDGLQPTFWDNFALCWSFSKEDVEPLNGCKHWAEVAGLAADKLNRGGWRIIASTRSAVKLSYESKKLSYLEASLGVPLSNNDL
jgi:hypothetical protein